MQYDIFARYYDELMYDVNYSELAKYLSEILKEYSDFVPNSDNSPIILDLGCGTGEICLEFAKKGYDMIGIDQSMEMLNVASNKALDEGLDVLFLNQDMTDFELYGTVSAIFCLMDGINHVTDIRKLKRMFKWAKNYLDPNGLFIFDINSSYKLHRLVEEKVFYDINDDISYIWETTSKKDVVNFDLTFFINERLSSEALDYEPDSSLTNKENSEALYSKIDVEIKERIYETDYLKSLLKKIGFNDIKVFGNKKFTKPLKKEARIFFVAKN